MQTPEEIAREKERDAKEMQRLTRVVIMSCMPVAFVSLVIGVLQLIFGSYEALKAWQGYSALHLIAQVCAWLAISGMAWAFLSGTGIITIVSKEESEKK